MKKSFFLFLLLLIGCIGSVSAVTCTIPETGSTSGYYVLFADDTLTWDLINSTMSAYDFGVYAPSITGIDGPKMYFASKNDLARFCSVVSYTNKVIPFNGDFDVYIDGILTPMTVLLIDGQAYTPYASDMYQDFDIDTSKTQYGYMYSYVHSDYSGGNYLKISLNGVQLFYAGGESTTYYYDSAVFPADSTMRIAWTNLHGYQKTTTSIVLFDYVDYSTYSAVNRTDFTISEIYTPPARYVATFDSNVDGIEVFDSGNSLGTFDNLGTAYLTDGTHYLTFLKDGYYNVTQTVIVDGSDLTVSVDMETTHLPVELTLTNSEGGLASVSMYIDDELVNTVSNGQTVQLPRGSHLFKFVKSGYWNETRTLNIDESFDSLDIRFYPLSVMYSIQVPTDINTFKNSEVPVTVTISPKAMSSSTKIYLSGKEVLDVRDSSNTQIPYVNGGYLIGDISVPTDITIKFMSGETLGTNALQMRVMGYGTLGQSYVTDTSFTYEVVQLPLTLTVPSKWNIGSNNLRISETEGENRLVMIQVEDAENNIVYSDSYAFSGYESHDFEITFEETGDYRVRILSGDLINSYLNIEVVNPILFSQTTITGKPGTASSLSVNIQNLFTSPQYYKVEISGDGLSEPSITEFSVSPGVTKSQTLLVPVGENLTFDSYLLTATVYLKDSNGIYENILEESIILNIDSTGLSVGGVDLSGLDITALIPSGISFGSISPDTIIDMAKNNPLLVGLVALFMVIGGSTLIPGGRKK
ncbi:hypothetical protein [Methanococcus maripaludis]|uniref:PEGA domain protein n=1 Tax=Methanococcus maripaludis TaxID=39152 RepID=A0A2L1C9M6_METMI|nr:hypothetical protein [Methanococcus maripaludis]AVB76082.1 hypothetical protein MMJJ_06680 [Methanococcus maripaludis]